jgi:aminopeptidase YwaD
LHASKLLVAQVRRYVVASWLASSGSVLGADAMPGELSLKVSLSVQLKQKKITQYNIVGRIEGEDPTASAIVIGAHYDHLGLDVSHSLAHGDAHVPHLGADDNASGTAAVLSLAYALQTNPVRRRRDIIVCFFAAEELGLLGSKAFVKQFKNPKEELFAMLNLDMVGRFNRYLYVLAADRSPYWLSLLAKANTEVGLPMYPMRDDQGRSDHASFLAEGVPALLFFTWFHEDYHTPSDTREKIDTARLTQITRLVFYLATQLDTQRSL